jgi:cell division protein FtsW (lipid II flippase)
MPVIAHSHPRTGQKRLRDLGLYILIGLVVAVGLLLYLPHSQTSDEEAITKWGGLAGNTLILFGYTISRHKPLRRVQSFWATLIALLIVHLAIFVPLLLRVEHWKVLWFVAMYPIETPLIDMAVYWATDRFPRARLKRVARRK